MTVENIDQHKTEYERALGIVQVAVPIGAIATLPFAWAMSSFAGVSLMTIISSTYFAGALGVLVFLKRAKGNA